MKNFVLLTFILILSPSLIWADDFAPLITPATGETKALFEKAKNLFDEKDYKDCKAILTPLVAENPMADFIPQARLILAEVQDDFEVSVAELREVAEEYDHLPQGMEAQKELGDRFFLADQYGKAIDSYQEFLNQYQNDPMAVEVHYWLGCAYLAASQTANAIDQYQKVVGQGEKTIWAPRALLGMGDAYFKMQKYSDAQNQYLRILDQYALYSELNLVYMKLGETYEMEKKWTDAYAAYETLVTRFPKAFEVPEAQTRMAELEQVHAEVKTFVASLPTVTPTPALIVTSPPAVVMTPTATVFIAQATPTETSVQSIPEEAEQEETVNQPILRPTPFHVQVGVYTYKPYVERLEKILRQAGYRAYVVTAKRPQDPYTFYKVRVGHFATRLAALRVAHRISRRIREKTIVVEE